MGISPWYVGMTAPALQITLNLDTGIEDITGLVTSNFTMILRQGSTDTTGTGTFTIVTAKPALVNYQFSSGDVATAGTYSLIIKAAFPSGVKIYDAIAFALTAV